MSSAAKRQRVVRRAGVVLLASTMVLGACGDDDAGTDAGDGPAGTEAPAGQTEGTAADGSDTTTETTEDTTPDTTEETPEAQVIDVTVTGGEVTGGGRQQVDLGETVTIRVTSDVTDHVHLHGYDVMVDVAAGETAELVFDATIPGVFEVELEDARIPLVELEIS